MTPEMLNLQWNANSLYPVASMHATCRRRPA